MKRLALSLTAFVLMTSVSGHAETSKTNQTALCHSLKGRPAIAACEAAIKADPDSIALRHRLGFAYLEADLFAESIKALKYVTTRWPDDWQGQFDLASVYGFLQAYPSAVAPIEAAMRLQPDHLETLMLATIIFRNVRRDDTVFRIALHAAALGERRAMFMTAYHYEYGVGAKMDLAQARHWVEKAAAAGHVGAMDQMAKGYRSGEMGFTRDRHKAEHWASRAKQARETQ